MAGLNKKLLRNLPYLSTPFFARIVHKFLLQSRALAFAKTARTLGGNNKVSSRNQ